MDSGLAGWCAAPAKGLPGPPLEAFPTALPPAPDPPKLQSASYDIADQKPTPEVKNSVLKFLLALDDASLETLLASLRAERPQLAWPQPVIGYAEPPKLDVREACTQFPDMPPDEPLNGRQSSKKAPGSQSLALESLERPSLPTAQFSAPMFFANEDDGYVEVEVMLVGSLATGPNGVKKNAVIPWETKDGSAKAGKKYVAASGKVEFSPSSTFEKIRIDLINNVDWDPTLDFQIVLQEKGVSNCDVHRYHKACRVKIIDDDSFPSNRFQDLLLDGKADEVPVFWLVFDYVKLNLKNSIVKKGVIKAFLVDFLGNCQFFLILVLKVYLINEILVPAMEGEGDDAKNTTLLGVISLFFLFPYFYLHYLAYRRCMWKLGGAPRKLLQANLMRKFMSYTARVRAGVDHGEMILILFKDIPHVVTSVFGAMFPLIRDFTMLFMLFLYQIFATRALSLKTSEDHWIGLNVGIMTLFPMVAFVFLRLRYPKLHASMERYKKMERSCTEYTIDMFNSYYLLADYLKRGFAVGEFEKHIDAYNSSVTAQNCLETNDSFIPRALSLFLCAAWIFWGGWLIVQSDGSSLTLGNYIAQWEIMDQIGASWQDIYEHLLRVQDGLTELQHVVKFLNYPVESLDEKAFISACEERGREIESGLPPSGPGMITVDELPIKMHAFSHRFDDLEVISKVALEMQQGRLHLVTGNRDSGKTTLLKLLGGRSLMQHFEGQGYIYIPLHLRVLHVSKEPLFFLGSLYENLTYGVADGDKDGRIERVHDICRGLNISEKTLENVIPDPKLATRKKWDEELSRSDRQLLNIARGLIANPEVLVIHKPCMGLGPRTIPVVLGTLQTYVQQRGIQQDMTRYFFRRPRTCIFSLAGDLDRVYADVVHSPFGDKGFLDGD